MTTLDDVEGVVMLPKLPPELLNAARARIDDWLSAGMPDPERAHLSDEDRLLHYTYDSYGDEALRSSSLLHRCFDHYTERVLRIIGDDARHSTIKSKTQIALRYPGQAGYPHLDGMDDPERLDDPAVPAAVLGIYLSDVGPDDGALGTWPQLLPRIEDYGRQWLADPGFDLDRTGYRALMAEAEPLAPRPVTGAAGTAFLFHGGLPHCNLANAGPHTRYALFLRLYKDSHYPQGLNTPNKGRALRILADCKRAWAG